MADDEDAKTPSRENRIDMAIPESFHRVKRTLIVVCSILILLAVSKPTTPGDAQLNMQLLSLHVPLSIARGLLWLSAAYYAVGLLLEADTARRVNTRLFDGGMGSFQDALAGAARRVTQRVNTMLMSEMDLPFDARDAVERIRQIKVDVYKERALELLEIKTLSIRNLTNLDKEPAETMRRILSEIIAETSTDTTGLQHQLRTDLERIEQRLDLNQETVGRVLTEIEAASTDLTKLSRRIAGSRRASFWYWEVGAGIALFGLATICTIHAQFPNIWTRFVAFHSAVGG